LRFLLRSCGLEGKDWSLLQSNPFAHFFFLAGLSKKKQKEATGDSSRKWANFHLDNYSR
jgi:hypothetical protein